MLSKLKEQIKDKDKRQLFENFLSLSMLQGANYILPLVTLPYLVRVLGPEKFGLIAFAQAFIQYFNILTDYGFSLSATREISVYRENKEKISNIFNSVMIIKFNLLVLSFIIMTIIVFSFNKFKKDWLIYYLTFGTVVGRVLFPIWFFQGMEKMKYITLLNITAKVFFTLSIFVFVHSVSDYLYVPILNSLGFLIAGILALWIIFKDFCVTFQIPSLASIIHQLKEGWYIFISSVAVSLYTTSNTFILGLFTNNSIVGYYSAAEKIVRAIQGLMRPISQAIYPYISKLVGKSRDYGITVIQKVTIFVGGINFILSLVLLIFSKSIVKIILGNQYIESVVVLRILSFLPFIIALSNMFGIQTMLTFDYKKAFSNILISASIINIVLAFVLVPLYQDVGIAYGVLFSELFVTISMFIYLQKKGIRVLEGRIV